MRPLQVIKPAHASMPSHRLPIVALTVLACFGSVAWVGSGWSQPGQDRRSGVRNYERDGYPAVSMPNESHALSFTIPGVVDEITVKAGDHVEPDQLLVRLNDNVQRLTVAAQRISAEDQTAVLAAEHRLQLANFDWDAVQDAEKKGAVAPREVERRLIEKTLREVELTAAQQDRKQSETIFEREQARLQDMSILSRMRGIVVRLEVDEGEAVDALQPVLHLVSIDPLWMDVAVPVTLGLNLEVGDAATIHWRDVRQGTPSEGRVTYISPIADAPSNSVVVRLEVDNPELHPAGLHANVRFPEVQAAMAANER